MAPAESASKTVFGYQASDLVASMAKPQTSAAEAPPQLGQEAAAAGVQQATPGAVERSGSKKPVGGRFLPLTESQEHALGALCRGQDQQANCEVDLLLVDDRFFSSPLDLERARREMRQVMKVDCPSIMRIVDFGKRKAGGLYVAYEAVSGRTLDQIVASGPRSIEQVVQTVGAVGTALAEAQKVGVIHRDIAPHNVVVLGDGTVKLRGFGLARPIKRHVYGTPEFLSPEQAAGRPVDQRSNIYSLGVLMYYMLQGAPPFVGDTDTVLSQQQDAEVSLAGLSVPPAVAEVLKKAMAKSSSRRHLTLRQFLREIDGLEAESWPSEAAEASSFETPLHGVTALTAGDRPPSSELPAAATARRSVPPPTVVPPAGGAPSAQAAAAQPAVVQAGGAALPRGVDPRAATQVAMGALSEVGSAAGSGPAPATAPPLASSPPPTEPPSAAPVASTTAAATPTPTQTPTPAPTPAADKAIKPAMTVSGEGGAVVGELSGGSRVSMRQSAEVAAAKLDKTSPPQTQPAKGSERIGFRETMWFFKGEVESAMAETGEAEAPPTDTVPPGELAQKYKDDGSLSADEAKRLSLRTGKTQMMQAYKAPSGQLPGERMKAGEFINEMNTGRRFGLVVGAIAAVVVVGGLLYLLLR